LDVPSVNAAASLQQNRAAGCATCGYVLRNRRSDDN